MGKPAKKLTCFLCWIINHWKTLDYKIGYAFINAADILKPLSTLKGR